MLQIMWSPPQSADINSLKAHVYRQHTSSQNACVLTAHQSLKYMCTDSTPVPKIQTVHQDPKYMCTDSAPVPKMHIFRQRTRSQNACVQTAHRSQKYM